jgi:hypothetical protein
VTTWTALGPLSRTWFILIAIALFGAGTFKTDPITASTTSWVNTIHTLCGAVVILTFPPAASLATGNLLRILPWAAAPRVLLTGTVLTWIGMVTFLTSIPSSRAVGPSADGSGTHTYPGWPNRFMVVAYAAWIMTAAAIALPL